jgi:hypothetical protein
MLSPSRANVSSSIPERRPGSGKTYNALAGSKV